MQPEDKEQSNTNSKLVDTKDNIDKKNPLNTTVMVNSNSSEVPQDFAPTQGAGQLKQVYVFRNLLFAASVVLIAGTAIFSIDLLAPVLLGCGVVGFNYFWTMQFVRKLLQERKFQALDLLFSFTKFGISVIILFVAMQYFDFSPEGLLIGLSNIALAILIYSFIRLMDHQKSV